MPVISEVSIANMALAHAGVRSTLETLTENTPEARQVNLWYDHCRVQALESSDWNFARKRLTLALHSEAAPTDVWTYRYQYPADCIYARRLANPSGKNQDQVPFEIELNSTCEEKTIVTNLESAVLIYTRNIVTPGLFSTLFVDAIAHLLASYVAYSLTGVRSTKDKEMEIYMGMIRLASGHNANEQAETPPRDAPWITGR